ncbi:MAG: hypothetical protein VB074_03730 [Proteiniphilum sp.]|uniref:hypothetical protein n=1 Tax=Proteiniphilum sp. TaxID=1926877 RepID=UPI002B20CE10|nr:hypothetical protein [Proteiniphilum sp.]MEA5127269.1 hypothetical protein [Proteiniphilum sp.]
MDSIGGYFGLELQKGRHYHKRAIRLNTARNCLEYILKVRGYDKVYIPYYTCEVILEPFKKCNVEYEFYHIDGALEPVKKIELKENEAFLYTNYFGLKQSCVERLARVYNRQLIVDNAQAFYAKPLPGIDTFYSARKFFGVADGAYLYIDKYLDEPILQDYSFERMAHLLKRIDLSAEEGYHDFQSSDNLLINNPVKKMSDLTGAILSSIDYDRVKTIRRENYLYLHQNLEKSNKIQANIDISKHKDMVPMVYPYLVENGNRLRGIIIYNKIFIATYWANVMDWLNNESLEYELANNILPLPIDQRYTQDDMDQILKVLLWRK